MQQPNAFLFSCAFPNDLHPPTSYRTLTAPILLLLTRLQLVYTWFHGATRSRHDCPATAPRRERAHAHAHGGEHLDVCVPAVRPITYRVAPDGAYAAAAPSIAALTANLLVLAFAAAIYRNRDTRRLLWRQSLLMLLSVQFVGVFYDIAFMCVLAAHAPAPDTNYRSVQELSTGPSTWCKASVNVGFLASERYQLSTPYC
jgi:hypothetical protein